MHIPVLLKEVMDALNLKIGEVVIDGTAGSGGHAKEILKKIGESGKLLLVDWDRTNAENLKKEFAGKKNVVCVDGNYAGLPQIMKENKFPKANALLLDLGFSSEQLGSGRGFSFMKDEPLVMTYSDERESLAEFLRHTNAKELIEIIRKYGEERYAKGIVENIMAERRKIRTTRELADVIKKSVPKNYERGRIHPATRTFQALRIYLNKEFENIEKVISSLEEIVGPGGRVAIISFHSLEDRIVKQSFNELKNKGRLLLVNKKPINPSQEEIQINPRSRSAKLRIGVIS